ncbi:hypothetical protein E4U46_006993 [Claviceps purpurea]|nr:hypothetical protein E4U46_006993 [Claviceps purpurea]
MTFQGPGGYELRFRPENRGGRCEFCVGQKGEDHTTMNCKSLAGTKVPENMPMRLEEKPVVTNENDAINALVPGQVENEDPSKSNDAKTHHASQDASIEESAALKRAVKRNKNKKTKSKRPTGDGSASAHPPAKPNKVVKPGFKAKLTKRGKRLAAVVDNQQSQMVGEGLLSNGKHLVFGPPPTKKEIDDGAMVEIVMDSLKGGVVPESVSPVKAHVWTQWTVFFATIEDAKASVGRGRRFEVKHGCTSSQEVYLEKYLTSGPRIFICDRQGPIINSEAQQLITSAEFLKGNKFWYGAHKRRGVEGAKRVLVLEAPPEPTTMAFLGPNEYELRFRPENRSGKCELSGATRPNIISTKSNENDAVNAQTHLEAKNAKDQMDKNPRKRKRNQIKGKGSDRTNPAKSNKVEKPGFSAKLTKRGKRQAKKPSDQNTTEGEERASE